MASSSSQQSHHHDTTPPATVRASEKAYQSQMMFVGESCHLSECRKESFLPFRCPDCRHQFCSDHYKTGDHHCSQASATFLVPLCPLCHEPPKNWKRDEDPNIAMNAHLTPHWKTGRTECAAVDEQGIIRDDAKGKRPREKKANECRERRCRKIMIVPIRCPSCHLYFCPSHRAPVQHECSSASAKNATQSSSKIQSTRLPTLNKVTPSTFTSKSSTLKSNQKENSKEVNVNVNPMQAISAAHKGLKTDKRARSEHASVIKAMQARHAKGLLTPAEQVRLAEEMALMQEAKAQNRDCVTELKATSCLKPPRVRKEVRSVNASTFDMAERRLRC